MEVETGPQKRASEDRSLDVAFSYEGKELRCLVTASPTLCEVFNAVSGVLDLYNAPRGRVFNLKGANGKTYAYASNDSHTVLPRFIQDDCIFVVVDFLQHSSGMCRSPARSLTAADAFGRLIDSCSCHERCHFVLLVTAPPPDQITSLRASYRAIGTPSQLGPSAFKNVQQSTNAAKFYNHMPAGMSRAHVSTFSPVFGQFIKARHPFPSHLQLLFLSFLSLAFSLHFSSDHSQW